MQIFVSADLGTVQMNDVTGAPFVKPGRPAYATVVLDGPERFPSTEAWGSNRRFQVSGLRVTLRDLAEGGSASGHGAVIRKDGSLGTARVTGGTSFPAADIPADLRADLQRMLLAATAEATRIIQTTPEGA